MMFYIFTTNRPKYLQVLVTDINSSLRRLMDVINEDNWMYDPIDLGQGQQHGR